MIELLIQNNNNVYSPAVCDEITYKTERFGTPGELTFSVIKDDLLKIECGDLVQFKYNEHKIFKGYIFNMELDETGETKITCYDQLRYFKNKDSMVFENCDEGDIVSRITKDFALNPGNIKHSGYKIKSLVCDNETMFDIIEKGLDQTLLNKSKMFVLYDSFGKICLEDIEDLKTMYLLTENEMSGYSTTVSIDDNTYNYIKLTKEDKDKGVIDVYVSKDSGNINKWGYLMHVDKLQDGENGVAKADKLLNLYNTPSKTLSLKEVITDGTLRAGNMIIVNADFKFAKIKNQYMLIEECSNKYTENNCLMDIKLRGGEFNYV